MKVISHLSYMNLFIIYLKPNNNKQVLKPKARFRRRTFHVPNLMQMSSNKELRLLTLGSTHEKFDV